MRASGPNPTQERMDEEGTEGRPVDVEWDDGETTGTAAEQDENEPSPHEGEEGQGIV